METVSKLHFVAKLRGFVRAEDGRGGRIRRIYADEDGRRRSRNRAIAVDREF